MKTAIAMKEGTINSTIDKHFGKCSFFCIYDDAKKEPEIIENPGKLASGCKGEIIAGRLAEIGVTRVIAGDFGSNVQQLLSKGKIQMILLPDDQVRVSDLIALLTKTKD